MSDPSKKLQTDFSNILQDLISMSAEVIKKSDLHLTDVKSLDLVSADSVTNKIQTLFERVNKNISSFKNSFDTAVNEYKSDLNKMNTDVTSSKKKISLSLKTDRRNGVASNDIPNSAKDDGSASDTDSEKSLRHFDVPVTSQPMDDFEGMNEELVKTLDELDKVVDKKEIEKPEIGEPNFDEMSFDFDETFVDETVAELDKFEKEKDTPSDAAKQMGDNQELLDLLTKAVGEDPSNAMTEEDGDAALKILDDEAFSYSADSDDSLTSESALDDSDDEDWKLLEAKWRGESESEGSLSDIESLADDEEPEVQLKSFDINLKQRVDHLDDAAIDRLCDLHNINKRKCVKVLKKLKTPKKRRIRVLTTSSEESSKDDSSTGSTTPDLVIDTQRPPSSHSIGLPDISALADEFAEKLDKEDEDVEISSDSDTEPTSPERKKRKIEETVKDNDIKEIKSEDEAEVKNEEAEKTEKKRGTWRDELQLWSNSDDDGSDDDDVLILNDSEEEKVKPQIADVETTLISDTDSNSGSDDVTFIDEDPNDDSTGKGRRNIRSILSDDELSEMTQRAKNEEDERIIRLEEHAKTLEVVQSQHENFVLDVDVKTGAPLVVVDHNLASILKPHQKEGVKFMWEACYESVEMLKSKPGTGCILAHCMGLGKTIQVITLIHTLFTHPVTKTKHVLIICPLSTVINWKNEFKKTFRHLNKPLNVEKFFIIKGDIKPKIQTVSYWHKNGGILVMGYETFQILTNDIKLPKRVSNEEQEKAFKGLLDPGPDLIICDEGHQLKNGKTKKTRAVMKVKTKRRIVLTGTPLQNNLQEYYYMVQFVKPHLLGTYREYSNRFSMPIVNGQFHDSRPEDIKLMKKRTHVLTKLLKKTVHRVEGKILASYLPELTDYTVLIKLTPLQMELYTNFVNLVKSQNASLDNRMFLHDVMILNLNNLHPYTLQLYYNRPRPKTMNMKKRPNEELPNPQLPSDDEVETTANGSHVKEDWYKSTFPEDVSSNVNYSSKLKLILEFLDQIAQNREKVLIFAQYLVELDLLEHFLKTSRNWRPNRHYYRMDGDTPIENRDMLCKRFNIESEVRAFLLTHRVGGLGLNLTGANRVIMIGSNHNPTLDTQSMYRVYRFGQEKKCFVYRLLSLATMEEKIYHRCVVKLHLSGTVVDKLHFARQFRASDLQEMYNVDFSDYTKERPIPVVPSDKLLAMQLRNDTNIYKYHPHNSLLENRPEEELTDEDKKLAWDEFNNMEEAARHVTVAPSPANPLMRMQIPIYPANPLYPYNRFGQLNNTRANTSTLVPNPMNSNTRGFIPRAYLTNGMPTNPQNLNFPRHNHQNKVLVNRNQPQTSNRNQPQSSNQNPSFNAATIRLVERLAATQRLQNMARDQSRDIPAEAPSSGKKKRSYNSQHLLKLLNGIIKEESVKKEDDDNDWVKMLDDKLS